MKRTGFILVLASSVAFTSCGLFSVFSGAKTAAKTVGTIVGEILAVLFSKYKNKSLLDLADSSTLENLASLGENLRLLKENENDKSYMKSFTKALVAGSDNLVTKENSAAIVESLLELGELGNIKASVPASALKATTAISGLTKLIKNLQPR